MKRLPRAAVLVSVIDAMKEQGSWCGETHIQKAVYFLQKMAGVPTEFEFVLYKYGPYSFDLTDELTGLRADSILTLEVPDPGYGPRYEPGRLADLIRQSYPKTIARYKPQVEWVANRLGSRGVAELERLSTALYVRLQSPEAGAQQRAEQLVKLKPHIRPDDAKEAIGEVDKMLADAKAFSDQ